MNSNPSAIPAKKIYSKSLLLYPPQILPIDILQLRLRLPILGVGQGYEIRM